MSIYCLIPARKGSKRIKNKNLMKLNNKYLISHSVEHAKKSREIKKVFVSTNDNKIINLLKNEINIIKRPDILSNDNVSTEDVISHFVYYLIKLNIKLPKYIVLLQCTSPLREKYDIDRAVNFLIKGKYDSVFSGVENRNLFWTKDKKLKPINYFPKKRLTEQKMKAQYIENGSIYVFKTKGFLKYNCRLFGNIGIYLMSKKNSFQLDDLEDKKIIEKLA